MRKNNNCTATKNFDSYKPVSRKEFDSLKGRVDAIDETDILSLVCDLALAVVSVKLTLRRRKRFEDLEAKTALMEKKLKDLESKNAVEAETAADAVEEEK